MTRKVILYGKPGCHLCEQALALLEQVSRSLPFALDIQEVDITTDPKLEEEYGEAIPVIAIEDGLSLSAMFIKPNLLRDALEAAAAGR
ncbi:MAG: glutaredoxin family protein [Chloroflexi bacterium]|nr:glutaredoxin family protein [Chloroflexota bacterium]